MEKNIKPVPKNSSASSDSLVLLFDIIKLLGFIFFIPILAFLYSLFIGESKIKPTVIDCSGDFGKYSSVCNRDPYEQSDSDIYLMYRGR